jgi:hypothetical protein
VATLDPGDHIVRLSMPAPEPPNATEVPLTLTFSAPAILVGPKDPSGTPLVTWTTMTSATGSDPKNPLPPPETDALDVSLLADSTWLRNTLTIQGAQAYVARSVP